MRSIAKCFILYAEGGNRTLTGLSAQGILSPLLAFLHLLENSILS